MPIYAYKCSECGRETEVLQKISDAPLTECPHCGRLSLIKQVTAAGFQLKGSGWYATDFKDKSAAKTAGKAEPATGGGTAETKTEAKSESSSDAKPAPSAPAAGASAPASTGGSGGGSGSSA